MKAPIAVTGANGFVGRRLCADLVAQGYHVRAIVRSQDRASTLAASEVAVVPDPQTAEGWGRALSGASAVIHLIARTHSRHAGSAELEAYRQVNVRITQALLESCSRSAVERFVYLSSIKAVGEGATEPYDEETPCAPEDAYGITKREAELLIAHKCREAGIDAVVVRAPLIYGPGVKGNFLQMLGTVKRRIPLPISCIHNKRSMLFVGNLSSAVCSLLQSNAFPEPVLHVADAGEPLSTKDLACRLGTLMGKKAMLLPAPAPFLRFGGAVLGRADLVDRLVGSLTMSSARIQKGLGWAPPYSVEEGLRQTVDWYLTQRRGETS